MKWLLKRWLKQLWEVALEVLDEWVEQKEKSPFVKKGQGGAVTRVGNATSSPPLPPSIVKQRAHDILKGKR